LSIKDNNGKLVESSKKITLYNFGGSFVTESLQLNVGNYSLTEFMILDSANNVMYATPMEGSDLAQYVNDPLPINFSINENGTTHITPQVLAITLKTPPESFGYVSFGFEVIQIKDKLRKVILDGISVQDTLNFYYAQGKVADVEKCTRMANSTSCVVSYSEIRSYDAYGKLESINGKWNASYSYENDSLKKIVVYKDNLNVEEYFCTTTFLKYVNGKPVKIKIDYGTSVENIELTFDAKGDLIQKIVKNGQGLILESVQIEYGKIVNPLKRLIETPSYSVLFFGFDELAFYYSEHVPKNVTTTSSAPTFPNTLVISYRYKLDVNGRLVLAEAYNGIYNVHNISMVYSQ
jgi:hypothetical protein